MWSWLRRRFVTGLVVTVPLVASVVAIVWVFRRADAVTSGLGERFFGRHVPGLGIIATAAIVLGVGVLSANVFGRRLVVGAERLLLHVPGFRTVYQPLKQIIGAFAPGSESGFKRVVLVDDPARGLVLGFLTREFTIDRGKGPEELLAVYVPTNNLYLGDVVVCRLDQAVFPDLTVEEGVRVFLTGGMGLPESLRVIPRTRV